VFAVLQNGYFWVGACVPAGRIVADDFFAFADIAEKCAPQLPYDTAFGFHSGVSDAGC
jgi:Nitrite/Sulfite reductase ferredoxin-like half domain